MIFLLACTPDRGTLHVHVPSEHLAAFEDLVAWSGHPDVTVDDDDRDRGGGVQVRVEEAGDAGAYRVTGARSGVTVEGGDLLGMQYGLAATLEEMGFRFFHPHRAHAPVAFDDLRDVELRADPPTAARNGLHLHTLHPIEGQQDFLVPTAEGLERAKQVVDWTVKNRGTHVEWVLLDEIVRLPGTVPAWTEHTRAIVDYAHSRGVTVGFGVQLFGSGNLQRAFDLVDDEYDEAEVDARLALLAAAGPDLIDLSFGEFSGEDPEKFVETANAAVARMRVAMPDVDVITVIHVGNYEDLRIEYQGEPMLYYFLAQFVDAKPWIHTVMYYNLYDDAGLAYLHEEFDEHRAFLLERLAAGEPVGYYPESAYWVAFDVNVPTYLPVYPRSRWTDLQRTRELGPPITDHTLFSSGWEWGYWQTDYLTLRMAAATPDDWKDPLREMWAPWGDDGRELAAAIGDLGDLQHDALIVDRLAPYLGGREAIIDLGDVNGIVSQPDRPQLDEIVAGDEVLRAEVAAKVAGLEALASETRAIGERVADLGGTDPWFEEVRDGVEIDELRSAFAARIFAGALALADGSDGRAELDEAASILEDARAVVARRHAAMHRPDGSDMIAQTLENATIYAFGYLAKADSMCFWERELAQLRNLVDGAQGDVPLCI